MKTDSCKWANTYEEHKKFPKCQDSEAFHNQISKLWPQKPKTFCIKIISVFALKKNILRIKKS